MSDDDEYHSINIKMEESEKCNVCEEGAERAAVKYCVDCFHWLCDPCIEIHQRFFKMTTHTLQDQASAATQTHCPNLSHSGKDMKLMYYCKVCQICICAMCRLDDGEHKDHDCVGLDERTKTVKDALSTGLLQLEANKAAVENQLKELNDDYSTASDWLDEFKYRVEKAVQDQKQQLERQCASDREHLEKELDHINERIQNSHQYSGYSNACLAVMELTQFTVNAPVLPQPQKFDKGHHESLLHLIAGAELQAEQKTKLVNAVLTSEEVACLIKPGTRVRLVRDRPNSGGRRGDIGTALIERNHAHAVRVKWDGTGKKLWHCMGDKGRYDLDILFD